MEEIQCKKCGQKGQPSQGVAYGGKLGEQIKTTICNNCWNEWMAQSIKIINELRLNLKDPYSRETITRHMKEFLNLQETPPAS
jgi:Fe-S cluster biosynthesis and repair protein YggX